MENGRYSVTTRLVPTRWDHRADGDYMYVLIRGGSVQTLNVKYSIFNIHRSD